VDDDVISELIKAPLRSVNNPDGTPQLIILARSSIYIAKQRMKIGPGRFVRRRRSFVSSHLYYVLYI
jgi:hypothetical protein